METRADFKTRFESTGVGIKYKQQPISVMYPADVDVLLRSLPNRSEYIRDAVIEKLMKDGLLQSEQDGGSQGAA